MKQYMLSVHHAADFYVTPPEMTPEEMQGMFERVAAFNAELDAAGLMVFGAGLMPPETATVVSSDKGDVLLTDGPYAETKEVLGGFWIIKGEDLDAALGWAAKASEALGGDRIEVRPCQEEATEDEASALHHG